MKKILTALTLVMFVATAANAGTLSNWAQKTEASLDKAGEAVTKPITDTKKSIKAKQDEYKAQQEAKKAEAEAKKAKAEAQRKATEQKIEKKKQLWKELISK